MATILCAISIIAPAQTQTLSLSLAPAVSLSVPSSITLTESGANFASFISATPLTVRFKIRNTQSSGTGSITVQATEFSPANGPRVANNNLTYSCSAATVGTACSGTQTMRVGSTTPVVTAIPASTCTGAGCSGTNPQSLNMSFVLANSPQFKTGTYSTVLTFTISAT